MPRSIHKCCVPTCTHKPLHVCVTESAAKMTKSQSGLNIGEEYVAVSDTILYMCGIVPTQTRKINTMQVGKSGKGSVAPLRK